MAIAEVSAKVGVVLDYALGIHGLKQDFADELRTEILRREEAEAAASFVHTYKGEGLTACGLEVVGPCPDCEPAT